MPETLTFQVTVESTERLDRFVANQLSISRTQSARLVAEGAVTVNGSVGRSGRRLARGDTVAENHKLDHNNGIKIIKSHERGYWQNVSGMPVFLLNLWRV